MTASFLNDNIEILTASIIASDGSAIDVRYLISDFMMQESIFLHCMNGALSLMDGIGLIDKLPIVGEEFFIIKFRTPEMGNVFVTKTFAIYNVNARQKVDDKLEHYTLNMISLEGMINIMTVVNKNYVGLRYDEIVKKIFDDFIINSDLKGGVGGKDRYIDFIKNKKSLGVDRSSGLQSLTTVGDNPFTIIQKCADSAQSLDYVDSDFVFYEDRDEFNFIAISSLLEQDPVSEKLGSYVMGDQGMDESRVIKDGGKHRFLYVRQLEYNAGPDSIKSSSTGMYGNKTFAFDPILKKRNTITNNYLNIQKDKKIPSFKTLDKNNLVSEKSIYKNDDGTSHTQYYINNIFDKNYEEVDYMKNRIRENTDRHLFHHDDSYKSRGRTTMKFSLLENYIITIAVGGNSNLKAGMIINVDIPLSSDFQEDKKRPFSHLFGNKTTNKFIIISVTHNFIGTGGRYFTMLSLAKDSYFTNINNDYQGKLKNDGKFE